MSTGRLAPLAAALLGAMVFFGGCGDDDFEVGNDRGATRAPANPEPASTEPAGSNAAATATPANTIVAALQKLQLHPELADANVLGKASAKVTLAVFEDFQCPFCLRFTATLEPQLVEEYVVSGKVRLEFHHFVILGPESLSAAIGAYCAGEQDRFWEFQKALFMVQAEAGQATAEKLNVGRFSKENLEKAAAGVGLALPVYTACVASDKALEQVRADQRMAQSLGLTGTPSFLLNGQPLKGGAPANIAAWRKLLDEAIIAHQ